MLILFLTTSLAVGTSFVCSVMEAVILSVSVGNLSYLKNKGSKGAGLLLYLKQHRLDDAISAILTLNTLAHTIGAALSGAQAAALWADRILWHYELSFLPGGALEITAVGLFTAGLTIAILVLSEIIPKTLGTVYATQLTPLMGYLLYALTKSMAFILMGTRLITKLITADQKVDITRGEIHELVNMATHQGTLTNQQSVAFANLLQLDRLDVTDVMTPRSVITMMPANGTVGDLLEHEEVQVFSRTPLYNENTDDVKGYLVVRQVLMELARHRDHDRKLMDFQRSILYFPESYTVGQAMRKLTITGEHIAVVLDEYGGVRGLITMEDLIETMLGVEIIDEFDKEVDMRARALKIRDERLARIEKRRDESHS